MVAYQALVPQCHGPLELGGRVQAVIERSGNRRELARCARSSGHPLCVPSAAYQGSFS